MASVYQLVPVEEHVEQRAVLFAGLPDVMDKARVAEVLGVSPLTVSREIARGRLACVHVGSRVRITKAQLLDYVNGGN